MALHNLVYFSDSESGMEFEDLVPLNDKINMPITFITTCGYEDSFCTLDGTLILDPATTEEERENRFDFQRRILDTAKRLDLVYLYDMNSSFSPEFITKKILKGTNGERNSLDYLITTNPETVGIIYP